MSLLLGLGHRRDNNCDIVVIIESETHPKNLKKKKETHPLNTSKFKHQNWPEAQLRHYNTSLDSGRIILGPKQP